MKLIYNVIGITFLMLLITSCSEKIDENEQISLFKSSVLADMPDIYIDSVGIWHNEYLRKILNNYSDTPNSYYEDIRKSALEIYPIEYFESLENVNLQLNQVDEMNNNWDYSVNDKSLMGYINKMSSFRNNEVVTYDEIVEIINKTLKEAEGQLSLEESKVLKMCASTGERSAFFWLSKEKGGSGEGIEFIRNDYSLQEKFVLNNENEISRAPEWIADDLKGGYGGAAGWVLSAAFGGPLGFGGYALAVGFSAAWSSVV